MRTKLTVLLAFSLVASGVQAKGPTPGGAIVVLAGPNEPGTRMIVTGRIFQSDGRRPAGGERIFVYHADAKGAYGERSGRPAVPGTRDARLSGWLTTDPAGRFEVRTIRPGHYPSGNVPQHIHFVLRGSNLELQFADDRLVDATDRRNAARDGSFAMVRPVTTDRVGVQHVVKDFRRP